MRLILAPVTLISCFSVVTAVVADTATDLMEIIQSDDSSDVDRANAFEEIGNVAGDELLPPLAAYLSDEQWSHYARFAFQKMEGEKVTATLLDSLGQLQGDLRLGVIETIGRRGDPTAISALVELLNDSDDEVSAGAAAALGSIGTADAATALGKALAAEESSERREALASALLIAGQRLVKAGESANAIQVFDGLRTADVPSPYRIGATENAILARGADGVELMVEQLAETDQDAFQTGLSVARVLPGDRATQGVTNSLASASSPNRRVLLILALRDRQDKQALSAVVKQLGSDSSAVQLAAIDATGVLGDASAVTALLSTVNDDNADAILNALVAIQDADVDEALLKAATSPNTASLAVKALGLRRVAEAAPLLFQLSKADQAEIREEAIVALGMTVSQDRFLDLFDLLKSTDSEDRKEAIKKAIHAAVFRSTDPDACSEALGSMIPDSRGEDRDFLFEQIRTAGGEKAVTLMQQFATGTDIGLQDASTKTLGRWLSADAGPVLLEVAQGNGRFANRALGGYIRIFRQFELPEDERVAMAEQALQVAGRPNERNAAIDAITRFPCVGSFELALDQLDVQGSEENAAKAILTIGRTVLQLDPKTGKAGLQQLIDANVNDNVTESAKALLQ